jgi:histidinol dehydrogenase
MRIIDLRNVIKKSPFGDLGVQRPAFDTTSLQEKVKGILIDVKQNGDAAIKKYTAQFDGVELNDFVVTENEITLAIASLSNELKQAIETAANNINTFHQKQVAKIEVVETMPGVNCWRKSIGIEKVGLYIPGGTAPLFSTILMLGIPAKIAGCKEVVLCSPPNKEGKLHPAILFAANLVGIN